MAVANPVSVLIQALRRRATILVVFATALIAAFVGARSAAVEPSSGGHGDVAMFQRTVERLRGGEAYYDVIGSELLRQHYPTSSVFNWRTPFLFSTLARVPPIAAQSMLIGLGVALLWAAVKVLPSGKPTFLLAFWLAGSLMLVLPTSATVMAESWTGILIGLAVCALTIGSYGIGVLAGTSALLVRELAAPFCVAVTLSALVARRWREAALWAVTGAAYFVYYGWHVSQVRAHQLPSDDAYHSSWLQFGGLPLVTGTIHWESWLFLLRWPATAVGLGLIVAGISTRATPLHIRVVSASYLAFFFVAGQSFNTYWGLVAGPTWAMASAYGCQKMLEELTDNGRRRLQSRGVR